MAQRGIRHAHVSLTDEISLAFAFVVIEGDSGT